MAKKKKTIPFKFGPKHVEYIKKCRDNTINVAEGAVRAGKTIDNVYAFAHELKTSKDKIHLASGSTMPNSKLNIGDANGFGLEHIFRGQCRWGKYKDNDALIIKGPATGNRQRIVIFAGAAKADSYKKIRGNSYGMWIATEINLHHESFVQEAFNRQLAAHRRKIFWDLNPDHPKAAIYEKYIDKYRDMQAAGTLLGGYHYEHFTIFDNVTISEQRRKEIISQYDPNSIWYLRDIEGKRCVAEGLIYRQFAAAVNGQKNTFLVKDKPQNLMEISIGVDFGGNQSAHAFVATAITRGYDKVIALASERHPAAELDPDQLGQLFVEFCRRILSRYGYITEVDCDSAEQVLIRGLKTAARKAGLGWLRIGDALKCPINDRINLTVRLMAQGRFFYTEDCASLESAVCGAIWDPKEVTANVRLDDGTSDIDTLDGFEYSIEKNMKRLIKYE